MPKANTAGAVIYVCPLLYLPANPHGIREGAYSHREIVALLRKFKTNPEAIQFIADMME